MDKVNLNAIKEVILKNSDDIKLLKEIKSYPLKKEAKDESEHLILFMEQKLNKEYPNETKRDAKKLKKREKSFRHYKPVNVDFLKLRRFLIIFFSIIFIGACVSWIILSTKNIKVENYFSASYWETVITENENGATDERVLREDSLSDLTRKNTKKFGFMHFAKLDFKENAESLNLNKMSFKVKINGRGNIALKVSCFDAEKMTTEKELFVSNSGYAVLENNGVCTFSVSINHEFLTLNKDSFIKIEFIPEKTAAEVSAVTIFGLKIVKF